jgi:hypothetical protein
MTREIALMAIQRRILEWQAATRKSQRLGRHFRLRASPISCRRGRGGGRKVYEQKGRFASIAEGLMLVSAIYQTAATNKSAMPDEAVSSPKSLSKDLASFRSRVSNPSVNQP